MKELDLKCPKCRKEKKPRKEILEFKTGGKNGKEEVETKLNIHSFYCENCESKNTHF